MKAISTILAVMGLAAMAGLTASPARADVIYTDQASFLANVAPGYYLETFNGLPNNTDLGPSLSFSGNGFSYDVSAPRDLFTVTPTGGTVTMSTNFPTDPLTITITSGNVTAIGGFVFPTNLPGDAVPGLITATLNDGSTISYTTGNLTDFAGFTSRIPIVSLTLTTDGTLFPSVDDLIVGTATPEPSTLATAGIGMVGFIAAAKRHRQRVSRSS